LANRLAKRNGHEDAQRRSRATANRILGTLRAALNHASAECRVPSDNAWRGRLKPFRNVAVARKRYLTVAEGQRLLNAAEGDFRNLAQAALQTGARYSELTRLKVHDFDRPSGTVGIAKSKAGKPRRVYLMAARFSTASPLAAAAMNSCCTTTAASRGHAVTNGGPCTTPSSGPSLSHRPVFTHYVIPMRAWR